jgi:hypothetical protein
MRSPCSVDVSCWTHWTRLGELEGIAGGEQVAAAADRAGLLGRFGEVAPCKDGPIR